MFNKIYFNYWNKLIFVVNKWSYDSYSIDKREKSKITEASFERDLFEKIESQLGLKVKPKVFYIDSFIDLEDNFQREKIVKGSNGLIEEIQKMREKGDT